MRIKIYQCQRLSMRNKIEQNMAYNIRNAPNVSDDFMLYSATAAAGAIITN